MRFFVTDRQRGKTTKLLQEAFKVAKDAPTCVLCFNEKSANILRNEFRTKLLASKLEIMSLKQFQIIGKMRSYKHIYIDDADQILLALVHESLDPGGNIRLATATGLAVADLKLIKEGAAQLWREAARLLRGEWKDWEDEAPMEAKHIAEQFEARALSLENTKEGSPDEIRDRSDAGAQAGSIQPPDPEVHQG